MSLKNLFGKSNAQIYELELSDIRVSKEIFDLILKVEKNLKQLKDLLKIEDVEAKDAKLSELENKFLILKSKTDSILADVKRIMDIEVQNKDYIMINDDGYLEDKYSRLETMSTALEDLLELIAEKPSTDELRETLAEFISSKLNLIVDSVNNVVNDDKHLESTYAKIGNL